MGLSGECSHRSETSCQTPASANIDTYALVYVHIEALYIPITCTCVCVHSRNANHTLLQGNGCTGENSQVLLLWLVMFSTYAGEQVDSCCMNQ